MYLHAILAQGAFKIQYHPHIRPVTLLEIGKSGGSLARSPVPSRSHGFEHFARIIQLRVGVGGIGRYSEDLMNTPNDRLARDSGNSAIGGGNSNDSNVVNGNHKYPSDRRNQAIGWLAGQLGLNPGP